MSLHDDFSIIGRFIKSTVQPRSSSEILQILAELLSEYPRIAGMAIYIEDGDCVTLGHSYGFAAKYCDILAAWDGIVAEQAITEALSAYLKSTELPAIPHCTPLIGDAEPLGALCIFADDTIPFAAQEIEFFDMLGNVVGVTLHNAHLYAAEQDSRQQIKQVTQRLLVSQELERERISNELHRNAVQEMVGLKIHLDMLATDTDLLHPNLTTAMTLCDDVLKRLSLLALALRPVVLQDLGLNTALHSFCREVTARTDATIHYIGTLELPIVSDAPAIALYRFLQESLSTVQIGHFTVHLSAESGVIRLSIQQEDETVGDKLERISLAGMRERLEAVDGTLTEEQNSRGYLLTALIQL